MNSNQSSYLNPYSYDIFIGEDDYETLMKIQEAKEKVGLDERPECQYGTSCYRQNPQHKKDFKHSQLPQLPTSPGPTVKRPGISGTFYPFFFVSIHD